MNFDDFLDLPEDMRVYLSHNGRHFSRKACEFAISQMKRKDANGKEVAVNKLRKEQVEDILKQHGVTLSKNKLYDFVFVCNMAMADYWQSAIEDEAHLARFVKDYIDDPDQAEGFVFNRWYADMRLAGMPIDWQEIL